MSSSRDFVFDNPQSLQINEARKESVRTLLTQLHQSFGLKTAIDVGCGIGYFTQFLQSDLKFEAMGTDGREQNILEASRRFPGIRFVQTNVETAEIRKLGSFDLVFCFGLLYHLENPLSAVRNLRALANRGLLLESMCFPDAAPWMFLRAEPALEDQSLTDVAFYPSEGCLVKMLYRAGFAAVYRLGALPDHDDFQDTPEHFRRRTVLYASASHVTLPGLVPLPEPHETADPWQKPTKGVAGILGRLKKFLSLSGRKKYLAVASRIHQRLPRIPIPIRLSYGAWWFLRNDFPSEFILGGVFEPVESAFVAQFLQPGMTVLDIGAHHGFYTMMASKEVGPQGKVFAFEPSAREREALLLHMRLNRCSNVKVQRLALANGEGEADFYVVQGGQTGCNSLRPPAVQEKTSSLRVSITTLDSWLKAEGIDRVDFIKLDVEGAELSVLQGASEFLDRHPRPVILVEVQDIRTKPWGYQAKEIIDLLREKGFRWFRLLEGAVLEKIPDDLNQCDDNLVAVPDERMAEVRDLTTKGSRT